VKRLLGGEEPAPTSPTAELRLEAERGRRLIEESRELVVVLDERGRVAAASRRVRESLPEVREGEPLPEGVHGDVVVRVPYEVDGHPETLVYLPDLGNLAAYEELRAGFTAAVSHELRTPLARILAVLESASLPGADVQGLLDQAQAEVV